MVLQVYTKGQYQKQNERVKLRCHTAQEKSLTLYASERSTFSFIGATDSGDGSWIPSVSPG